MVTSTLMTLHVSFWPSLSRKVIHSTLFHWKGLLALSDLIYYRALWFWLFLLSKTTKICSLPPIFEILPVKSLKARNQTLAPPFPELRYLSLAYNKVTFCSSTVSSGAQMGGWDASCSGLKTNLPFNSLHYRYMGSGILRVGKVEGVQAKAGVHLFSHRYLFSTYHVSGSVVGTRYTAVERDLASALLQLITYKEDRKTDRNKSSQYEHA